MKIGIDARFFGPECKGLGRYTQKLIEYLEEIDKENEYYIFLTKKGFDEFIPSASNFKKILADYRWYTWREQLFFPSLLNKYKLDVVHFCHFNVPIFYRKKFIVTIHDLILFHYPTIKSSTLSPMYYFFKLAIYHLVVRFVCRKASKIIAVSFYTKEDLVQELKITSDKIRVIYEGYAIKKEHKGEALSDEAIFKKYGIIKPYLLYVGNAYPHKNLERLCQAFVLVKKDFDDLKLVIVGRTDYFTERLKEFIEKRGIKGIVLAGFVSDEDLGAIYKNAQVFVFPSLYEGVGLPPLEAISKNVAVASSDRTSMPEILGEGAEYFNPEDPESMAKVIRRLILSENRRNELIKKGKSRLSLFSWSRMARETKEEYLS